MSIQWSEIEFESLDLGHKRINKRAVRVLEGLSNRPSATLPQAFNTAGEMKACYRFFDNDLVTHERLLAPHKKATIKRIKEHAVVLILSDTSSLNYSNKPSINGLGTITHECNQGIWSHTSLAVTPQRLSLGVTSVRLWERKTPEKKLTNHQAYKMPIQDKELYRWIESYKESCEIARECPDTQIVNICDREGDFAELFEEVNIQQRNASFAHIIVRAAYDRKILEEDDEEHQRLKACLEGKPSIGKIRFVIPESKDRKSRNIIQVVTSAKISFRKRYVGNGESPLVTMNAIMAREENPPEGIEALCWFFITSLAVESLEDAKKVIECYLTRWEIEIFFNVLKNGCKIEERQLRELSRLKPLIVMYMIVAWRVMYTMMLGRICEHLECIVVFNEYEWKSAWKIGKRNQPLPEKPPSLGEFIRLVATFGGYINSKNSKAPGVKVMWKGLQRLRDFSMAWEMFENETKAVN
jgi:transposase-like protein/transposase Tn5 family protein